MDWFKSKEEKEREKKVEEARKAILEERLKKEEFYDEYLSKVIITPENQESYERRVGYVVEVVDTKNQNKGVIIYDSDFYIDFELKRILVEGGVEAIVETNYSKPEYGQRFYGLPVRRKNGGPYR